MIVTTTLAAILAAYENGILCVVNMMERAGKDKIRIDYGEGPRCFNINARTGESDLVTEVAIHPILNANGPAYVRSGFFATGESGTEYPLGDDYDGQDNYVLSDLYALVSAVNDTINNQQKNTTQP